jgi:signal transduction histidine kinase
VVLLDLSLPDSRGLQTFKKQQAKAPQVPIIVLTGLNDEALAVEAVREGAQDYLVKGHVDSNLLSRSIYYAIERKQVEETLRQRTADLEARNEELDAFAHTVAHDLKDPLGLLVGYCYLLMESYPAMSPGDVCAYLEAISQSAMKMSDIIDSLLLLAAVRTTEVEVTSLDMGRIVTEAQQRLAHVVERYQAEILRPAEWPTALGYGPWVEEIWANYISNALKYGGRPPRVELGATLEKNGTVCFWVKDNGRGLTPGEQENLFKPFMRLDRSQAEGHGLGLSIVRRIVERLSGQVRVVSEVGKGSTFSFTLDAASSKKEITTDG